MTASGSEEEGTSEVKSEARSYHGEESFCLLCVGVLEPKVAKECMPTSLSSMRRIVDVR